MCIRDRLKTKVSEGRKRLSDEVQLANDAKQWVEAIQEYANITELDAATLNRLIKEIVVHERIDEDKTCLSLIHIFSARFSVRQKR